MVLAFATNAVHQGNGCLARVAPLERWVEVEPAWLDISVHNGSGSQL